MEDFKQKVYSEEIEKIRNFFSDTNKILFIKKEGDSEFSFISNLFAKEKEDFLFFKYFCSKLSMIEDILLDFYDTLRIFSVNKRINLRKSEEEDFSKKIISYVKEIPTTVIITIENFEKISNNKQITGFIENLAACKNTKIIIYTKNDSTINPYGNFLNETNFISIPKAVETNLKDVIRNEFPNTDESVVEEFIEMSKSSDFGLFSAINYLKITDLKPEDLIKEFQKRKLRFKPFILSKMVSLVPSIYLDVLNFMSIISQPILAKFMKEYEIGTKEQIDYLSGKTIILKTCKGYLLEDEYKKYFKDNLTLGEEANYANKIIEIFNNEITKKPQDRLLRLSREGLRKRIEYIKENLPQIKQSISEELNFNINKQTSNTKLPWLNPENNNNDSANDKNESSDNMAKEDLELLKKIREQKYKDVFHIAQKKEEALVQEAWKLINQAEEEFKYENAINMLHDLANRIKSDNIELSNKINEKIAKNLIASGNSEEAIIYYSRIADNFRNAKEYENSANYELKIARIYQDSYNISGAKKICTKIIDSEYIKDDKVMAQAYYRLGSISEKESNEDAAIKYYKEAYNRAKNENELLKKITFSMALLYSEQDNNEEAKKYYLENLNLPEDTNSKNVGICCMNLATIFYNEESDSEAIKYFNLAIEKYLEDEKNNYSGLYYANRNMAKIYKNFDNEKCKKHLEDEFKYAKALGDNFKIINAVVELGDYYYDTSQDRKALVYYIYAKNTLKDDESEQNQAMINMRIEDMRLRMPKEIFEGILIQHANDTTPNI